MNNYILLFLSCVFIAYNAIENEEQLIQLELNTSENTYAFDVEFEVQMNDLKKENLFDNVMRIKRKVFSFSQNELNEPIKELKHETLIEYNLDGYKIFEQMISKYHKSLSRIRYDSVHRIIDIQHSAQDGRYGGVTQYSYQENVIEVKQFDTSGRKHKRTIEMLNEFGLPYEKRTYDKLDSLIQLDRFVYDENKNLINHLTEISSNSTIMNRSYEYDDQGKKTLTKNANGTIAYEYNSKGLLSIVINNSNQKDHQYKVMNEYDIYGHLVLNLYFKESQLNKTIKYDLVLDDSNNIIYSEKSEDGKIVEIIESEIAYY